jgi:NitT/TauT family transport system substrate-binding protein
MSLTPSRRSFLASASLAGAAGMLPRPVLALAGQQPETQTVRFERYPGICIAPTYVAEELLHAEGMTDVHYIPAPEGEPVAGRMADGTLDFGMAFMPELLPYMDAGASLTVLAGVHVGCFDLFGNEKIQTIADLRGARVGVPLLGGSEHMFIATMAAYVGLDPATDIHWVDMGYTFDAQIFTDGEVDAFLQFPPVAQELRARRIGHVVVSSAVDRPWSQYICCFLAGNADYVRRNPIATRAVLKSVLKAADLCAEQPEWAAGRIVEGGFADRYDYALQTLQEVRYDVWRDYDHEDSVRFYALRLKELGMVRLTPNEVIADFTDWRALEDVKRELKA